jgi:hypothetical protein
MLRYAIEKMSEEERKEWMRAEGDPLGPPV